MNEIRFALSLRIQELIDNIAVGDLRGNWPWRVCKEELNALPLHGNRLYLWALRADGLLLCMDHEAFNHPVEPEYDPLIQYAVLTHGARIYPDLQELVPLPPNGTQLCLACAGTGAEQGGHDACLNCSGLGYWRRGG